MNIKNVLREHRMWLNDSEGGERANLSGADLRKAVLSGAVLSGAVLRKAVLSGAVLRKAVLRGAVLREANLVDANLSGADLSGADLREANLVDAHLRGANLSGARGIYYISFDSREWTLISWRHGDDIWFNAGCRSMIQKDALEHWSSAQYPDPQRGTMYVIAIRALMALWDTSDT